MRSAEGTPLGRCTTHARRLACGLGLAVYSTGADPGGKVGIFAWPGIVSGGNGRFGVGVYFDVVEEPGPVGGNVGGGGGSDGA